MLIIERGLWRPVGGLSRAWLLFVNARSSCLDQAPTSLLLAAPTRRAGGCPNGLTGTIARQQAGLGEARYAGGAVQDGDDQVSAGGSPTSPGTVRGSNSRDN
jgi:hypothetical protein